MKKILMLLTTLFLAIMVTNASNRGIYIKIERVAKPADKGRPRAMDVVPFSCFYDSESSAVHIEPLSDVGEVSAVIVNEFTGETEVSMFDSSEGFEVISISGTEGNYSVTLTTEFEEIFEGSFTIWL